MAIPSFASWVRSARTPPVYLVFLASLVAALASAAVAQAGLYGPEAPQDVSFVRVLNGSSVAVEPQVQGDRLASVEPGAVGPYVVVEPGPVELAVGTAATAFEGFPEAFTTVVVLPSTESGVVELRVLDEAALRDISRGLLSFWNLAGGDALTLATSAGAEVFADVPDGFGADRAIAQAEVGFVVTAADGREVGVVDARVLERGVAHAIFVLPPLAGADAEGPRLVYAAARAEP